MKGLIQRVSRASVSVEHEIVGEISTGLLLLLGIERNDTQANADKLLKKILGYRVFPDTEQRMNLSVSDICGGVLVISQFTLAADTLKGTRPGFSSAAAPVLAEELYRYFVERLRLQHGAGNVATGIFAADMQVSLINDGPVTFMLEG